jgi:hypothetical protein
VEAGRQERVFLVFRCFKTYNNLWEGENKVILPNNQWEGRGHGQFLSQARACHYLASLTFESRGRAAWTPMYTYVNSRVPHPQGRRFQFFLTYCNYHGALQVCQGKSLSPKLSLILAYLITTTVSPKSTIPTKEIITT